ncbi:MAG: metallophosphoesterase [Eubacterium sp.]|nr:metallophosphoesterase [Eubacterium sp.]
MDIKIAVSILIAVFYLLYFLYLQNNTIDLTRYEINSNEINETIKLIHLSDLHSKPFMKVIKHIEIEKPDIILITGDFINDKCKRKEKMLSFARQLTKYAKVYYITGNHERRLDEFETLMQELEETGFNVLLNDISSVKIKGNELVILGLDENQANFEDYKARRNGSFVYKDMSGYFNELQKLNGFKVVLSHYPENFKAVKENNYSQYDFDLQLSGHAHGGQFILPFIGPVFSPGQGLFPKYARGSFGDRPRMIVSRGLANAEFPFRLFNHPEINIIELKKPR